MAKNPRQKTAYPTKKHLARLERERLMRRWLIIGTIAVFVLVVALVVYGILNENVLKARRPVAIVNGESIRTSDYQAQVRYARSSLINNALNTYQFVQLLGNDPQNMSSIVSQLAQVQAQLNPTMVGQQVLDSMGEDILIRQEAERRGITVTEEDIDKAIQEALGYFPNGTPTSEPTVAILPTSTISPQQMTMVPPTATPTETAIPSPTASPTMTATTAPTATETSIPTITPTSGDVTHHPFQAEIDDFIAAILSGAPCLPDLPHAVFTSCTPRARRPAGLLDRRASPTHWKSGGVDGT